MRITTVAITAAALVTAMWGCRGTKAGDAAAGGDRATKDAAAAARKDFNAKVAEVETYMRDHDAANTPRGDLRTALTAYQGDFVKLAAQARPADAALASRCTLAAESMGLYAESLSVGEDDPRALERALAAEAKWREAKGTAGVPSS